jgi:hypothetical protein
MAEGNHDGWGTQNSGYGQDTMPFDGHPMIEPLVGASSDQSSSREPYWIVTHHPIMRPDGTRVPARTRALYCPATHLLLFGADAAAAATHT